MAVGGACREGRGRWSWRGWGCARCVVWDPARASRPWPVQDPDTCVCFWSGLPTSSHPRCPGVGRPLVDLLPGPALERTPRAVHLEHLDGALPAPPTS